MLPKSHIEIIVERGEAAKRLMENPDWLLVMNELGNFHVTAMAEAPPRDASQEAIRYHHTALHAVRDIAGTVADWAAALNQTDDTEDEETA